MERRGGSEKFQPRIVASFSKAQLLNVFLWSEKNVPESSQSFTQDFLNAVEAAEFDEKGKQMDEKGRKRLSYAIKAIGTMVNQGHDISQIQGLVSVWQVGPEEDNIEVRWNANSDSRSPRLRRY